MRCEEVQDLLVEYWDMSEKDSRRIAVDQHIQQCELCAEEYKIWQESAELIKSTSVYSVPAGMASPTSSSVMRRIYKDESWRVPVHTRIYHISFRLRRHLTIAMSFFLALMCLSLYFAVSTVPNEETVAFSPILPVASAASTEGGLQLTSGAVLEGVPVASISDPLMLTFGPVETDPNYWMVLSLLGIVTTLLVMNWLSRIRA